MSRAKQVSLVLERLLESANRDHGRIDQKSLDRFLDFMDVFASKIADKYVADAIAEKNKKGITLSDEELHDLNAEMTIKAEAEAKKYFDKLYRDVSNESDLFRCEQKLNRILHGSSVAQSIAIDFFRKEWTHQVSMTDTDGEENKSAGLGAISTNAVETAIKKLYDESDIKVSHFKTPEEINIVLDYYTKMYREYCKWIDGTGVSDKARSIYRILFFYWAKKESIDKKLAVTGLEGDPLSQLLDPKDPVNYNEVADDLIEKTKSKRGEFEAFNDHRVIALLGVSKDIISKRVISPLIEIMAKLEGISVFDKSDSAEEKRAKIEAIRAKYLYI